MNVPCALGLDLGTSGLKAILVADDGSVVARASEAYDVISVRPGCAEIDPRMWERAARAAVSAVLGAAPGAEVVGLGIDGQMHGAVLIDAAGEPVRPAVLWPDSRAVSEMPRWRALDARTQQALANPLTPGMAGPILGWLSRHEPEAMARAVRLLAPKDWLRSRLVKGSLVSDPSDASATLLWSVARDGWDRDLCRAVGVEADLLPPLLPSAAVAGTLGANGTAWGLPAELPVSVGCADSAATILGTPALPGRHTMTVGTGAQVVLPAHTPRAGPIRYHSYRQADDNYYAMAALMNAGLALSRVIRMLDASWEDLYRPYDGSRDLPCFLPFLSAERLPVALGGSAGSWFGLGLATERQDLLAAALEGVAFAVRRITETLPAAIDETIGLTGGGTQHPVFVQLIADVLERPVRPIKGRDATAAGAAILAWRAAGRERPLVEEPNAKLIEPSNSRAYADDLSRRYQRFLHRCDQLGVPS